MVSSPSDDNRAKNGRRRSSRLELKERPNYAETRHTYREREAVLPGHSGQKEKPRRNPERPSNAAMKAKPNASIWRWVQQHSTLADATNCPHEIHRSTPSADVKHSCTISPPRVFSAVPGPQNIFEDVKPTPFSIELQLPVPVADEEVCKEPESRKRAAQDESDDSKQPLKRRRFTTCMPKQSARPEVRKSDHAQEFMRRRTISIAPTAQTSPTPTQRKPRQLTSSRNDRSVDEKKPKWNCQSRQSLPEVLKHIRTISASETIRGTAAFGERLELSLDDVNRIETQSISSLEGGRYFNTSIECELKGFDVGTTDIDYVYDVKSATRHKKKIFAVKKHELPIVSANGMIWLEENDIPDHLIEAYYHRDTSIRQVAKRLRERLAKTDDEDFDHLYPEYANRDDITSMTIASEYRRNIRDIEARLAVELRARGLPPVYIQNWTKCRKEFSTMTTDNAGVLDLNSIPYICNLVGRMQLEAIEKDDSCKCVKCDDRCPCAKKMNLPCKIVDGELYPTKSSDARNHVNCSSTCACAGKENCDRFISNQRTAPLMLFYVDRSKEWGVLSVKRLKKGHPLGIYGGVMFISALHDMPARDQVYFFRMNGGLAKGNDDDEWQIDGGIYGGIQKFFNHSCNPNMEVVCIFSLPNIKYKAVAFITTKEIEIGEELCFTYNQGSYGDNNHRCYCGAKNCRGHF